ncbi:hypothetical protein BJ322DRAFT_673135 [Thelephora terrestris]|uniref:Uncharacterized protein n=1 Tax=Thelephora terrestris TaxID=56493 RepID=A0A9P6L839_9AGAM|nr:hypothetical protein BJ322DRAFT_673135 [Thelephora terrestris]
MTNVPVTAGFAVITVTQFVLGTYAMISKERKGAQLQPEIPLDAYRVYPCVLVGCFQGKKVEGAGAQVSDNIGYHRGGFDALLHGYIHFPLRTRSDPEFWTAADPPQATWSLTQDTTNGHTVRSALIFGPPHRGGGFNQGGGGHCDIA